MESTTIRSLPTTEALIFWRKFGHIRRGNTLLGLYVPTLTTPLEPLGGDDEQNT